MRCCLAGFDRATQILDLRGIPKEIVFILQGVILLSVVVAYAVVEVRTKAAESRAVTGALQTGQSPRGWRGGRIMTSLLSPRAQMMRTNRWLWLALGVVATLAITRTLADTPDLTSSGTFRFRIATGDSHIPGRAGRGLRGTGRNREHWTGRNDDPRHLVRGVGGMAVGAVDGTGGRSASRGVGRGCFMPWPP